MLTDRFGRHHDSLRISVTDRCNLRCRYCMPEGKVDFLPRREVLSFEEIERIAALMMRLGVRKMRLTGGEPLLRRGLPVLVARLAALPGLADLGLTTNGLLLAQHAAALYDAGLRRLNVSLDSLDPETFNNLVRDSSGRGLRRVLDGIMEAKRIGFRPIKINAVAISGTTDRELAQLGRLAREWDVEVRFIELMPLDSEGRWMRHSVLSARQIVEALSREVGPLRRRAVSPGDPSPAQEYEFADGCGRIGIIASVTEPFCSRCNRLRIAANGRFRYCLFALEDLDVRALLRSGGTDEEIEHAVRTWVTRKWEGHQINADEFIRPPQPMHVLGG
ncbi:MAG: GTP 3',8-cyclase MoaA [Candidatus Schekmanbacteria bacterium]|nr:GTP 3',8-cyclase MoaA [Candidatus Schekmanbacteria bacterium]